ncbi:MAG: hypothetical protein WC847_02590 [Candidatus Paceibacterota bacterium]|jgi:hypothetical protein
MTTDDLVKQFNLPFANFSEPIKWQGDVGFSTTQSYGDGYGSLYKFGIHSQKSEENLRNLSVSVSYGKETEGGISLGTGKRGIFNPLDLNFSDEFSYSESQGKFFHYGEVINAKDILLYIEKMHKKPTNLRKGFFLITKLWFWREALPAFIKFIDIILIYILLLISGEKIINNDIIKRYFSKRFDEKNNQKTDTEFEFLDGGTMTFFGYTAKRWSVVFYCSLHLVIYVFFFYLQNNHYILISRIGKNSFLIICYVVISFVITESVIPKGIKAVIAKTPRIFTEVAFKSIKVS